MQVLTLEAMNHIIKEAVKQGGATINPYTLKPVNHGGWVVGLEEVVAVFRPNIDYGIYEDIRLQEVLIEALESIQMRNESPHSTLNHYLGLWVNSNNELEIEKVIEIHETETAITMALEYNQKEIYHLSNRESINLDNIKTKAVK